jgi:arginyl-tRNA synthetase
MYTLNKYKTDIAGFINKTLGVDIVEASSFSYPPSADMGDISLPCFVIAKNLGQNPAEMAEKLVALLGQSENLADFKVAAVFSKGPYLNFRLKKSALANELIKEIIDKGEQYGQNDSGGGQKTMIEFSNANTHKEFHVGHLRNLCFGDSVHRLMQASGYESIPVSYINDFGIHVAKTLWAFMEFYKEAEVPENKGFFLGQVYVRANREMEEKPHYKDLVNFMMKKIESRQGPEYELWQKTRLWSIDQMARIYEDLGVRFEKTYYESETIDEGREMVKKMLMDGVLKESDGAVIADLEEHDLGVLVFLRSDKTATYPVADLPLAIKKFEEYGLDASIYVVDIRQALYFKQLFFIMKEIGYKKPMIHLGYDFVKLPDGMMSSRSGNVITYEDLKALLYEKIQEETKSRHPDWSLERVDKVVRELARSVIKFEMLKVGAQQPIIFDIEKALSFQGYTAAYILYAVARINSIIKKSGHEKASLLKFEKISLDDDSEHELLIKAAKYPEVLAQAAKNFDPSILAKYIFELAQDFNDYYHRVPILKTDRAVLESRLALILSLERVMINGLDLLGIETLEEM